MGDGTGIEWTDATWNPTVGCTKVSPGCDNCYAETFVNRFAGSKGFPLPFDEILLRDQRFLDLPGRWKEPRRIFVNSLSDLFHADIPDQFIVKVFDVMLNNPRHTFQLLTKRHARMRSFVTRYFTGGFATEPLDTHPLIFTPERMPPNIWLGVSVEDQHWADIRIPTLLDTPAAVRWVSAEPLLGPVSFRWAAWQPIGGKAGVVTDHLDGLRRLDWVVAGGESGPGARPMHPDWPRQIRDQCAEANVPFLFKQWGNWAPGSNQAYREAVVARDDGQTFSPPVELWEQTGSADALNRKDWAYVHHAGKKAAGRVLDGRTHDGYPIPSPTGASS